MTTIHDWDRIEAALTTVGVRLNSTLAKSIQSSTTEAVLEAIAALEEAQSNGQVFRPGGWLKRAIDGRWKPNGKTEAEDLMTKFNEWFKLAQAQGIVIASTMQPDGSLVVFDRAGIAHPFAEMLLKYPISELQRTAA